MQRRMGEITNGSWLGGHVKTSQNRAKGAMLWRVIAVQDYSKGQINMPTALYWDNEEVVYRIANNPVWLEYRLCIRREDRKSKVEPYCNRPPMLRFTLGGRRSLKRILNTRVTGLELHFRKIIPAESVVHSKWGQSRYHRNRIEQLSISYQNR